MARIPFPRQFVGQRPPPSRVRNHAAVLPKRKKERPWALLLDDLEFFSDPYGRRYFNLPTMIARKPIDPNNNVDGSGTKEAVKVPDCELVMLLPEVKSDAWQGKAGQK